MTRSEFVPDISRNPDRPAQRQPEQNPALLGLARLRPFCGARTSACSGSPRGICANPPKTLANVLARTTASCVSGGSSPLPSGRCLGKGWRQPPTLRDVDGNMTFVSADVLHQLTGKRRPSAQARWLAARCYKFERRGDGTIVLRMDELDAHTISRPGAFTRKRWEVDLSQFNEKN